jgi:hypothetical protein
VASRFGPVEHSPQTHAGVFRLAHQLVQAGLQPSLASVYQLLHALDRLSISGLSLVVHTTYAQRLQTDGAPLTAAVLSLSRKDILAVR